MIAHLSGTLFSKQATSVIVDVGGVGYEVTIPLSTFYDLEDAGKPVQLRIYTHVREDTLQLFGFKTIRERELFLKIISVSGIGPKLGITLLSGMSADELIAYWAKRGRRRVFMAIARECARAVQSDWLAYCAAYDAGLLDDVESAHKRSSASELMRTRG